MGGGVIGAACAYELARAGATVTLLEREELAAGASGRNNGLWVTPTDPQLLPMARASLRRYLELVEGSPIPYRLDRESDRALAVALDEDEMALERAPTIPTAPRAWRWRSSRRRTPSTSNPRSHPRSSAAGSSTTATGSPRQLSPSPSR